MLAKRVCVVVYTVDKGIGDTVKLLPELIPRYGDIHRVTKRACEIPLAMVFGHFGNSRQVIPNCEHLGDIC